jgi:glycosyltransferase involved in cell wall biosynthesis
MTPVPRKPALLIAFHYPPIGVSSGVQRTLAFSRYLGEYGWDPLVLTVHPRAYETVREDQLSDIPATVVVKRAFALDTRRHLAVGGRYPRWLAIPDRWISWLPAGVAGGLDLVRRYRPAVIWSTFPIATAHLIALTLHRLTGVPWVADCRDPMTEPGYRNRPAHSWLEHKLVERAARVCFTSPGTLRMYAERYPRQPPDRWLELPNGYDDEIFNSVERSLRRRERDGRPLLLVHSGVLYPRERNPRPFFSALARLKAEGAVGPTNLRVVLRATGHDDQYASVLAELGIADVVELAPATGYRAALQEMLEADGLLIFQAANCNIQVPAKLYECMRAKRPIFALTDAAGDTASVLRGAGVDTTVPMDDADAIAGGLRDFLQRVRAHTAPIASDRSVQSHSRRALAGRLVESFEAVTEKRAAARKIS